MRGRALKTIVVLAAGLAVSQALWAEDAKKPKQDPGGSRWALLIGVDNYAEAEKLKFCGADMVALQEQLVAAGFPENQVFLLHDKADDSKYRPLKANVERQLELVLSLVERDDFLVVAFSGHGVHLNGKSYLCPTETRLDSPKTMVPLDEVYDRLHKCQAALKLLLVDACRNDPRPGGQRSLTATEGSKQFASSLERPPEGILLLASCAPGQISMEEKEFGHGVFMHYLLEGLQGKADQEGNGRVSLMDLYKYVNRETKTYVARKFNGYQTPALKGDLTSDYELATCAPRSKVIAAMEQGKKYWRDNKYDLAIAEFTNMIRMDPKNAEAYRYRGLVYNSKGERDIAVADFNDAIRVDPKHVEAYDNRASYLRDKREFDKARADYDAIIGIYNEQIRLGSRSAEVYLSRSRIFANKASLDYDEARNRDEKAVEANPRVAYNKNSNLDKAIADLTEAIRVDPKSKRAYGDRSWLYNNYVKDLDKARADLDGVIAILSEHIRLNPASIETYRERSRAYLDKAYMDRNELLERDRKAVFADEHAAYNSHGNIDKAIADLTEAIRLDPKSIEMYRSRAILFGGYTNDLDSAIADYAEIIHLDLENKEAYFSRAGLYEDKARLDYDEERKRDEKATDADPARAYNKNGNLDKAIADLTEVIRFDPKPIDAYFRRASIYENRAENPERAIADYTEIIRLDPKNINAFIYRGSACTRMRDYRAAIANYEEAMRVAPDARWAEDIEGVRKSKRRNGIAVGDTIVAIRRTPIMDGTTSLGTMQSGSQRVAKKVSRDDKWIAVELQQDGKKQIGWVQKQHLCTESELEMVQFFSEKSPFLSVDKKFKLNSHPLPAQLRGLVVLVLGEGFEKIEGSPSDPDGNKEVDYAVHLIDKRFKEALGPHCSHNFSGDSEWHLTVALGGNGGVSSGGGTTSVESTGILFNTREKVLAGVLFFSGSGSDPLTALKASAQDCASKLAEILDNQVSN